MKDLYKKADTDLIKKHVTRAELCSYFCRIIKNDILDEFENKERENTIFMTDLQIANFIKYKGNIALRYIRLSRENNDKFNQWYFEGYLEACYELYCLIKNQIDKELEEMEKEEK